VTRVSRRSLLIGAGGAALAPALLRAAQPGSGSNVVVVGAGVFGTWTATELLRRGHRVTLIDAYGPAHSRASSGGESRMTRAGYGKDEIYTRMARDSLPRWKSLSDEAGLPIFVGHGVLFFTGVPDAYFTDSVAVHQRLGMPIETLDRKQLQARFPMIDFGGVELGLFEAGFGALMARRAVQTLTDIFVQRGGRFVTGMVEPPAVNSPRLAAIRLANGETIAADRFVFAAGPWLPKLFPDVIGERIRPTRQEVFYFAPPAGDRRFLPAAMPGWADFNGGDIFYGFPDLEGRGVKFAHDAHGVKVDPDTQDRRPTEAALAEIIAFRDRRFPALRGAPLTSAEVCQYENSSNGDFIIDLHPAMRNVVLLGGGSGHGFKHGPEVGRRAALLALGDAEVEPRFSLAAKSADHKREVH
jgi:sarcosine oxidase